VEEKGAKGVGRKAPSRKKILPRRKFDRPEVDEERGQVKRRPISGRVGPVRRTSSQERKKFES